MLTRISISQVHSNPRNESLLKFLSFEGSRAHLCTEIRSSGASQAMAVPAMWVLNGTNGEWIR